MPTYEYACPVCGQFTAVRPMAEYQQAQPCPRCQTASPRVTLTGPSLGLFTMKGPAEGNRTLQSCAHLGGCRCC